MTPYQTDAVHISDHCPPLPVWYDIAISSSSVSIGIAVTVSCLNSYKFPDGDTSKSTVCQTSGKWDPYIYGCYGKLTKMFINVTK